MSRFCLKEESQFEGIHCAPPSQVVFQRLFRARKHKTKQSEALSKDFKISHFYRQL